MRSRLSAAIATLVFLVVAPGLVAGLVPWRISGWRFEGPFLGWRASRWIGVSLIVVGTSVLVDSFARFALEGRGTPAPPIPTERLVVSGLYRYVRNPMYLAVVSVILGQSLLFGSQGLLLYGAAVWLGFHGFVRAYEEPTLRRSYREQWTRYASNVPRWRPRSKAYRA